MKPQARRSSIAMAQSLASIEAVLYRLITAPGGVAAAAQVEPGLGAAGIGAIIRGDERMPALTRLEIYSDAYFHRLREVMKEDYPAVAAVLGEGDFADLVREYLVAHPPSRPSVFHVGEFLADFLRGHRLGREFPFAADLALLERALIEAFHGPDAPALREDYLRSIAPAKWPALAMRAHPTVRVVRSEWKVADVRRMVDAHQTWCTPAREPSRVLVRRQDDVAYYREMEHREYRAFDLLLEGSDFAALCEAIAGDDAAAEPAATVSGLLHRCVADGVLAAVA
jgi:hypothetical protein